MLELPEALCMAVQLHEAMTGKTVRQVLPPSSPHKFCWFNGDPADYHTQLAGAVVSGAEGFGIFAELAFANGSRLCFNDGVNVRLSNAGQLPRKYQLAICFSDGSALSFSVAMYGGIVLHHGDYDNEYYLRSREALSPFAPEFEDYFYRTLAAAKPNLSAKAFLATEQRFPGLGNGVLQDILFAARLHPKRKIDTLSQAERQELLFCLCSVLRRMTELGGRDTEKDLYGAAGGYQTLMCKNTVSDPCPRCGGAIVKEAYLGGSVYYCPHCQPL